MIIEVFTDRCKVDQEIEEIFWEMFSDLLKFMSIDFDKDIDHTDKGTFSDSLREMKIYVDKFPDINGFKVFQGKEIIFEMAEESRTLIYDNGYFFKVKLEFWSILEEQIDLGD